MPILPKVGTKSPKMRAAIFGIYFVLILGAITMVYPFLITVTGSMSNAYDYEKFLVLPEWTWNREEQFVKYLAEKYRLYRSEIFEIFASAYNLPPEIKSFRDLTLAKNPVKYFKEFHAVENDLSRIGTLYQDYLEFFAGYDPTNVTPLFYRYTATDYQRFLQKKYEALYLEKEGLSRNHISRWKLKARALDLMNDMDAEGRYDRFEMVGFFYFMDFPYHLQRWFLPMEKNRTHSYLEFLEERLRGAKEGGLEGPGMIIPVTGKRLWNRYLFNQGISLDDLNARWGTRFHSYFEVPFFTSEMPENPAMKEDFESFLQNVYPLRLAELRDSERKPLIKFLEDRTGSIKHYNALCETSYASFDEIPFRPFAPENKLERNLWIEFVKQAPISAKVFHSAEADYQNFLEEKYSSLDRLNEAYGTNSTSFASIQFPFPAIDVIHFNRNQKTLFWKFAGFSYAEVLRFITTRGRALFNTGVLVGLAILGTLLVNPLAAYALSRYRLKATQKILLFLLATMSFPAEVAMIPNFLLLRDLHLLNTYGALILPALASGFSIFLLKGFFDSLPPELYEAASIDGAGEWTMFWRITMPLCQPILAYMVLGTFVAFYGSFMWAFLVCQDERMWTLMVWLYQFQLKYTAEIQMPYMVMAGFVIASIPTLLVVVFCQRIILRGIVIPSMK